MRSILKKSLVFGCAVMMASCQQGGVEPISRDVVKSETNHNERFGYSVGYNVAKQLMKDSVPLDITAILAGLQDGFADKAAMTEEEMVAEMRYHDSLRQVAFMANMKAQSKDFLDSYRSEDGVTQTESGLMYKVIQQGENGVSAGPNDQAVLYYKGTLADGTVFDQTQPGSPATFPVSGLIPGFTEGLMLMKTGDKFEICIPSDLGYGANGNQRIPPHSTLIFEVELLDVQKGE